MATEIITHRTVSELVTNSVEAYSIASLIIWITEARDLIEKVRASAALDVDLCKLLRNRNVAIGMAEWGEETADGMNMLLVNHRATVRAMANTAEILETADIRRRD
jgi:hypothetical protein